MNTESFKDRNFRGQGPDEHVLAFCRKHWTGIFHEIALFVALFLGTIIFLMNREQTKSLLSPGLYQILLLTVGMLLLYYVHRFFIKMIEHFLTVIIVTDMRLIIINKSIYFINDKEYIDLLNIQEVHKSQSGFMQNVCNFGDLQIKLAMSAMGVELTHIPNPDYHFRLINNARRAYMERRASPPPVVTPQETVVKEERME